MAVEDRGPEVAAVAILFLVLSCISVSLRCYVRAVMIKSLGLDDLLSVAALVSSIPSSAWILGRRCMRPGRAAPRAGNDSDSTWIVAISL